MVVYKQKKKKKKIKIHRFCTKNWNLKSTVLKEDQNHQSYTHPTFSLKSPEYLVVMCCYRERREREEARREGRETEREIFGGYRCTTNPAYCHSRTICDMFKSSTLEGAIWITKNLCGLLSLIYFSDWF